MLNGIAVLVVVLVFVIMAKRAPKNKARPMPTMPPTPEGFRISWLTHNEVGYEPINES